MGIEAQLKSHSCKVWAVGELPLYVYTKISMILPDSVHSYTDHKYVHLLYGCQTNWTPGGKVWVWKIDPIPHHVQDLLDSPAAAIEHLHFENRNFAGVSAAHNEDLLKQSLQVTLDNV